MNAPGPEAAGAAVPGAPGLDSETWEGSAIGGGAGFGEIGPELIDALAPWVENIRVNSPGPEAAGAPVPGAPGLVSETWEGPAVGGGAGIGEIGPELIGAFASWVENIRVNSPGLEAAGAPEPGARGLVSETWEGSAVGGGAGIGEIGPELIGALAPALRFVAAAPSVDALALIELNIRVNVPGAADPAAVLSGFAAPLAVGIATVGSTGVLSIATGLKTRFTSSVRPELCVGVPPAPGVVRACSMRVNSPGLPDP